ncbi:MAG: Hsp20/alpha crystallin family protein [Candidatus Binatia bacterium]
MKDPFDKTKDIPLEEFNEMPYQAIPVRIYQSADQIMVAAPMPGLEPQDISVTVAEDRIAIRGEDRGPRQDERDLLLSEWRIGPYYREISLPQSVNGPLANATYGNGVLILSLPKMDHGEPSIPIDFQLQSVDATHGERVGHTGKGMRPTTTQEHAKKHR